VDYRLLYTQKALNDLAEIVGHIAEDDSASASRFGSSLLDHIDLLTRFPRMGALIRKRPQVRKLVHSPVLVYYRIDEGTGTIEVLHLRHGARKPPESEIRGKRGS
jgi:plasmid stabilization system protein ParE